MIWIAWTTAATRQDAENLARRAVESGLAACAQVDGPIQSLFPWEGKVQIEEEFRLVLKFVEDNCNALEELILQNHPYDTPQWICVRADRVAEKYLLWAKKGSN